MKKMCFLMLVLAFLLAGVGCNAGKSAQPVRLVKDASYFSDFRVEDDTVYLSCKLTLENTSLQTLNVRIYGFSEEDVKLGLLRDGRLIGVSPSTNEEIFTVPAGERVEFQVDFCGEYGGTNRKADRLLPEEIEIEVVK